MKETTGYFGCVLVREEARAEGRGTRTNSGPNLVRAAASVLASSDLSVRRASHWLWQPCSSSKRHATAGTTALWCGEEEAERQCCCGGRRSCRRLEHRISPDKPKVLATASVKRQDLRKNSGYRTLHTVPRLWLTTGRSTIQRVPARGTPTRLEYQLGQAFPAAALQENCSKRKFYIAPPAA